MPIVDLNKTPLSHDGNTGQFLGYRPPWSREFPYDIYNFLIKPIRDDDKILGNELLKRFLTGAQADFRRTYEDIWSILDLFDYLKCPEEYLDELLFLLGFTEDGATAGILNDTSELDKRRLLWAAAKIWKTKGTEICYEKISNLLGGIRIEINNWFYYRWLPEEGAMGEEHATGDPWIVSSVGEISEPDEYRSDIVVMDEEPIEINRKLMTDVLALTRSAGERLDVSFVEYLDFFADDNDVETVAGSSEIQDGSLVHLEDDTLTVAVVNDCDEWTNISAAWQILVNHQEMSDPLNKFRLIFHYLTEDDYDFVEVNLGAGTGLATISLGRRNNGDESTLATRSERVDLDVGFNYMWRVQVQRYYSPGTTNERQQIIVLKDQDRMLIHDESIGVTTHTFGNVGEMSFKARITMAWKEVYQKPLYVARVRPELRVEPRFVELEVVGSTVGTQQFAGYGGGGEYRFRLSENNSGGSITPEGYYQTGYTTGVVDHVTMRDRFGVEVEALVEVD